MAKTVKQIRRRVETLKLKLWNTLNELQANDFGSDANMDIFLILGKENATRLKLEKINAERKQK